MAWAIKCNDSSCGEITWADNIATLLEKCRNSEGMFVCKTCGKRGYIEKSFKQQELGETWNPFLLGAIPLWKTEDQAYHPFVFLVSYDPNKEPTDLWFSYFKDLRGQGGRLKMGYGPGGPPVLDKGHMTKLMRQLLKSNYFTMDQLGDL